MGWFDLQFFETWWRALTAAPSITLMLTAALMGIGWMIRGAFAKAHMSELNAQIEKHDQRIALLKEQQEDAAKKAKELRRQITRIAARPEAQFTLAEALKQAEMIAAETTESVGEIGVTLAGAILRQSSPGLVVAPAREGAKEAKLSDAPLGGENASPLSTSTTSYATLNNPALKNLAFLVLATAAFGLIVGTLLWSLLP